MPDYRVPVLEAFSWQPPVKDKDLTEAPGAPSKGDRYLVAASGGDWSGGAAKDITYYDGSDWQFDTPSEGWICWVEDENLFYHFDGTNWVTTEVDAISDLVVADQSNIVWMESDIDTHKSDIVVLKSDIIANASNFATADSDIQLEVDAISDLVVADQSNIVVLESVTSDMQLELDAVSDVAVANASDIVVLKADKQDIGTYEAAYGAIVFTI